MKVVKISLNPITGLPMILGDFRKNNLNIKNRTEVAGKAMDEDKCFQK